MNRVGKLIVIPFAASVIGSVAQASMVDALIYNVAGQVTNAVGSRLGDEIYYGGSRKAPPPRRRKVHHKKKRKHKKHVKRVVQPVYTDQHRIQKALSSLGFYHGKIDGQANSYETRSAIKAMNNAYGIGNTASLRPEVKDTLIYIGNLFAFDRYLISNSTNSKAKNKKIQTALKIEGFYHDKIDGALGRGSRNSIMEYKSANGLTPNGTLDFEEEYQLVMAAKEKNDKNLEDAIQSIKDIGARRQRSVAAPVPAAVPSQPQMSAPTQTTPVNTTAAPVEVQQQSAASVATAVPVPIQ